MKGTVMGVRLVNFTNPQTGEVIQGTSIYVAAETVGSFGKIPYKVWAGAGTSLESKLASFLKSPATIVGKDVDFSFKPKSNQVLQFDILN